MHLTFSSDIECSISERTISGKIVPFENEVGYTSAGKVIFAKGSIEIPDSPKPKLSLEHDPKKPIDNTGCSDILRHPVKVEQYRSIRNLIPPKWLSELSVVLSKLEVEIQRGL